LTSLRSLDRDQRARIWLAKRLEAGVFKLPKAEPGTRSVELRGSELAMILDGIDIVAKCAAAHLRYLGCKQKIKDAVNDRIGLEP
jgi:hypothetical protein